MSSWMELLVQAAPGEHVAQLYGDDDQLLARNVSRYLSEGLTRLDGLVVIATPEHTQAIARHLTEESGASTQEAGRAGRLVCLDARGTLEQILLDGSPDKARFEAVVGGLLAEARSRSASGRVRAFGEMVSLLWSEDRFADAALLESYWNELLAGSEYSLYCAYRVDLFAEKVDMAGINTIVGAHTHLFAGAGTVLSSGRTRN